MASYKNPTSSWREKDARNRKQALLNKGVCEKYCAYNIHKCGRRHPWSEECPPCTRLVTVKNVCGHDVVYECDTALNLASSFPCPTCGFVATQNNRILMPLSSQHTILDPHFHQRHPISMTTDRINYSIRYFKANSITRQIVGLTISVNPETSKLFSMQTDYYPPLCTKYCPNNRHICNVYHSYHDQCPPCSHIESVERPCGHKCSFMCYTAQYTNWLLYNTPCSTCQNMDNQNTPATFPSPHGSQMFMLQQQPAQSEVQLVQASGSSEVPKVIEREKIYQWINDLANPTTRENALSELCKIHEEVSDMAEMLWYSFGSISSLLQEIVSVYPYILQESLTSEQSKRVCKTIILFQCLVSHYKTRSLFVQAHIPLLLYPFLNIKSPLGPLGYLRLNSLGFFGTLIENDDDEVVQFLLDTESIPLWLSAMQTGSELCATAATYILYKILFNDAGLNYICTTYAMFSRVKNTLDLMIMSLAMIPSVRLLRYVINCYFKLSKNPWAREAVAKTLPDELKDTTFTNILIGEKSTQKKLSQLLKNLHKPSSFQSHNPGHLSQYPSPSTS